MNYWPNWWRYLSAPQRLLLGIPKKKLKIGKIESARGKMGSWPALSLSFFPQRPHNTEASAEKSGDTETRCLHYFRPPYLFSSEEYKYGVPIFSYAILYLKITSTVIKEKETQRLTLYQGSLPLWALYICYTFWRTTQQRKTAQTWDLGRLLIYRYSIISEILGFRHSTILKLVFDGVTVKTTNEGANVRKGIKGCRDSGNNPLSRRLW